MPQNCDKLELMKRIMEDKDMELTPEDLKGILEKELAKSDVEMDAQLVKNVLELLEKGIRTEDDT